MSIKQRITSILFRLKHSPLNERLIIPIRDDSKKVVSNLELIVAEQVQDLQLISQFAKWRKQSEWWFPKQFNVTIEGTRRWLQSGVIDVEDRVLFLIVASGVPIGHIGLYRFDYQSRSCELDNVLRGESGPIGVMTFATMTLMNWSAKELGLKKMTLRVFSDNNKAISLYERVSFTKLKSIPLRKVPGLAEVVWEEDESLIGKCERSYVLMQYVFK